MLAPQYEVDLPDKTGFYRCPDEAICNPGENCDQNIAVQAEAIAKWVFATYCLLVRRRVQAYNFYRAEINKGSPSDLLLGQYRRACRLAVEQITRRDLPYWRRPWDWNFQHPILPVFEIEMTPMVTVDEIVTAIKPIRAVVEVRQVGEANMAFVARTTNQQPEWSSSSSSSSESEFDPI